MIRAIKEKWKGVSDEGLYEAVADCLTIGAGFETSEFTVDDVQIGPPPTEEWVSLKDMTQFYMQTVTIRKKDKASDTNDP